MFVYNIKFNGKTGVKIIFIIIAIVITLFFLISAYRIYKESIKVKDNILAPDVTVIESENYTNVLKAIHDNPNNYIGQKISCKGYIYKLSDFNENEFVIARDMIISSNLQTLIVGFLCNYDNINTFDSESWVEITGEIKKGNYHGEIPIIEISNIKQIDKPEDFYVYPPDDNYVPTAVIF